MKRTICCLLALLLSMTMVSCGESDTNGETTTVAEESETIETETEEDIDPHLEAVDCEGRTFTILSRLSDGSNYCYPYHEFLAEEATGEAINDAIFQRNSVIADKYNLVLETPEENDVEGVSKRAVTAGDAIYDVINVRLSGAYNLLVNGVLQQVNDLPYVNTEKPYWWASVMENASIGGKNYFLTGDLNLSSMNGVGVVFFNKEMADQYGIDDMYDTVREGNWTLDTFTSYCKGVSMDLNGDQMLDEKDQFGLTVNGFVWQPFFSGTGSTIIGKDEDDIPVLAWDTERNINIMTKLINFMNDKESVILVNQYPTLQVNGGWGQASIDMFSENRALFWIEIIYGVQQLREMDKDFGILPIPKFDDAQENYTSYIHCGWAHTTTLPLTNGDTELTGRLLEDIAYQSSITVRPAFYDTTLKGKISRDNDSGDMLDIIYAHINLDLVVLMADQLPVDTNMRSFLIDNNTDFTSKIASLKSQCETKLAQNVEKILELEH